MDSLDLLLVKYQFNKRAEIFIDRWGDDADSLKMRFKFGIGDHDASQNVGLVYIWVAEYEEKADVIYVGKVGSSQSLRKRMAQHVNGTRPGPSGSNSGRQNAREIFRLTENGYKVFVYSRIAEVRELVGERVSLESVEEEAFILKFSNLNHQLLNRSSKKYKTLSFARP